ncbi:flagellar basal body rod protein FlgC [Alphaproteobacteria bacterium]|nr:flagellar basal body rod protein FlgC [Alphaproteobacteria bacterium]
MMKIKNIFDIAGRAMAAQMVRLNTISSNLANAGATTGDPETVYKPLKPEFKTQYSESVKKNGISTVNVSKVVELQKEPFKIYEPNHPLADGEGYIYKAPINVEEEMVDMMDASRQYQNNIEVVTTLKALTLKTINLGK